MKDSAPDDAPLSLLDGSRTIEELTLDKTRGELSELGKRTIKDLGNRMRQIAGLKPGSTSIRTSAMIDEIIERLEYGETLASIHVDSHMPAVGTLHNWRSADPDLDARITLAEQRGQNILADLRMDIALGGHFSTGDARRDELVVKTINTNISQRNRAKFGERVQVDHARVTVNLPVWSIKVSKTVQALEDHSEADPED